MTKQIRTETPTTRNDPVIARAAQIKKIHHTIAQMQRKIRESHDAIVRSTGTPGWADVAALAQLCDAIDRMGLDECGYSE